MKFWTIDDLRNPKRKSGFDHVSDCSGQASRGRSAARWRAQTGGWKAGKPFEGWRGPSRRTPEEAAQDYCDYVNGRGVVSFPTLKGAGHDYDIDQHSKDEEEEAALGVLRDKRAQRAGKQGYVYAITDGEYVKIGYSVNPPKRVAELQTGNARLLALLGTIPGTESDERKLHAKYEHLNVLQEWFEIDTALLDEFTTPAAMQQAA